MPSGEVKAFTRNIPQDALNGGFHLPRDMFLQLLAEVFRYFLVRVAIKGRWDLTAH